MPYVKINPYWFPGMTLSFRENYAKKVKDNNNYLGSQFQSNSDQLRILEIIILAVGKNFSLTPEQVKSGTRKDDYRLARHIIAYIANIRFRISKVNIGKALGDRDHSTIVHSISRFRSLFETDEFFKKDFEGIEKLVLNTLENEKTISSLNKAV